MSPKVTYHVTTAARKGPKGEDTVCIRMDGIGAFQVLNTVGETLYGNAEFREYQREKALGLLKRHLANNN